MVEVEVDPETGQVRPVDVMLASPRSEGHHRAITPPARELLEESSERFVAAAPSFPRGHMGVRSQSAHLWDRWSPIGRQDDGRTGELC